MHIHHLILLALASTMALNGMQTLAPDSSDEQYERNEMLAQAIKDLDYNRVEHALNEGADPNAIAWCGFQMLALIAESNQPSFSSKKQKEEKLRIASLLLEKGADPNSRDITALSQPTILHIAALKKDFILAHLILAKGANPNALTKRGHTPLMLAARSVNNTDIIKLLLSYNADPSLKNNDGETALDIAYHSNPVAQLLEKALTNKKNSVLP